MTIVPNMEHILKCLLNVTPEDKRLLSVGVRMSVDMDDGSLCCRSRRASTVVADGVHCLQVLKVVFHCLKESWEEGTWRLSLGVDVRRMSGKG